MRNLKTVILVGVLLLAVASPALAQDQYDCSDFVDQGQAQENANQLGAGDPSNLDSDDDGIVCEELPTVMNQEQADRAMEAFQNRGGSVGPSPSATPAASQYGQYDVPLPATGGPPLALLAGVLLVSGGLVARRLFR